MSIRIMRMQPNQVGPCRVLAEGGFLGGLLAPRFHFSYNLTTPSIAPKFLLQGSSSSLLPAFTLFLEKGLRWAPHLAGGNIGLNKNYP